MTLMSARYRIKQHKSGFTPQKRVLGWWLRMAPTQKTMEAASEIIRSQLKQQQQQRPKPARPAR